MGKPVLAVIALLLTLLAPMAFADFAYPANPQRTGPLIVLSDQGVNAYDSRSLQPQWSSLTRLQTDAPTLAADRLLVGSSSGLHALDVMTGDTVWQFAPETRLFSPSVQDDIAYVAGIDGVLRALTVDTGRLIWQRRISTGWIYPPAIVDDLLITGGQEGLLWGLDRHTGDLHWQQPLGQELVYRPVAGPNGSVIVTTFDGIISTLQARNGELIWQRQHPVASFSPTVDGDRILLTGYDNRLRALDIRSGHLLWSTRLTGHPAGELQLRVNRVLSVRQDGTYLLLDSRSGTVVTQGKAAPNSLGGLLISEQELLIFSSQGNNSPLAPVLFLVSHLK